MSNAIIKKFKKIYYRKFDYPFTEASNRKKFIFIHIPRSAGTSIRLALGEPPINRLHLPWWVYKKSNRRKFSEYFKFSFLRDPAERALSGFNYLKSGGNQGKDLEVAEYLSKYSSFENFVHDELLNGFMIYHPIFRPQSWYICDWKGSIQVDYIGHYDSIEKDFEFISSKLRITPNLTKNNSSKKHHEEVIFSPELLKNIRLAYQQDYNLFNKMKEK